MTVAFETSNCEKRLHGAARPKLGDETDDVLMTRTAAIAIDSMRSPSANEMPVAAISRYTTTLLN